MKQILTFLFLLTMLVSCSKNTDIPEGLVGTTWVSPVHKDQLTNKDTYNYLAFTTKNTVESYSKYNKTDLATAPKPNTYEYNPSELTIKFIDGQILSTVVTGNKFTLRYYNMDFVYKKEN